LLYFHIQEFCGWLKEPGLSDHGHTLLFHHRPYSVFKEPVLAVDICGQFLSAVKNLITGSRIFRNHVRGILRREFPDHQPLCLCDDPGHMKPSSHHPFQKLLIGILRAFHNVVRGGKALAASVFIP